MHARILRARMKTLMSLPIWLRVTLTLGLALASMCCAPTRSWVPLRHAGQWVGFGLVLSFTAKVTALVLPEPFFHWLPPKRGAP